MSNIITINLGRGRTSQQAFEDAALSEGWTENVIEEQELTTTCDYSETETKSYEEILADKSIEFKKVISTSIPKDPKPTDQVTITYVKDVEVSNPVSQIDYGKEVWRNAIDTQDRSVELKASDKRYALLVESDKTIIS